MASKSLRVFWAVTAVGVVLIGSTCVPQSWLESGDPDCGDSCDHIDDCGLAEPVPGYCDSDCDNVFDYECPRAILSMSCKELERGYTWQCEPIDGGTSTP
jgi:hypothetical protein